MLAQPDQHDRSRRVRILAQLRELHRQFGVIKSSNYDISDVCNLRCEGCLYFSGLSYARVQSSHSPEDWDAFFRSEAQRGVNFGYFAGAEPSLVPDILRAASNHISGGVIHTNGIKRIDRDIRYRIHLSLWGGEEKSVELRGASNVVKALRNYEGDERAIAVYTITKSNIDDIVPVSELCSAHGMPITFSYYSPTDDYLSRLHGATPGGSDYYRISSKENSLALGAEDFLRAHQAIVEATHRFPAHVWYSLEYDKWITRTEDLYNLDGDGVATDCGNRLSASHRHFNVDLSRNSGKCCSPNIECRNCRAYAQGYATLLGRSLQFSRSDDAFKRWTEVWELWMKIFLLSDQRANLSHERVAPSLSFQ